MRRPTRRTILASSATALLGTTLALAGAAPLGRPAAAQQPQPTATATVPIGLALRGSGGGSSQGVAAVGDRVYVGSADRIEILHRPTVDTFARLGRITVASGVSALAAADGELWAGDNGGHVHAFDLSDPDAPALLAVLPLGDDGSSAVTDVALADGRLYAALGGGAVAIVDRRDAARPLVLGRFTLAPTGQIQEIAAVGSTLYVAARGDGLHVVDTADPAAPRIAQTLRFGDEQATDMFDHVAVLGVATDPATHRVYATLCHGIPDFRPCGATVAELDASSPLEPREVGRVAATFTSVYDMASGPSGLYVATGHYGPGDWFGGLSVIARTAGGTLAPAAQEARLDHTVLAAVAALPDGDVVGALRSGGAGAFGGDGLAPRARWAYVGLPDAIAFAGGHAVALDGETRAVTIVAFDGAMGPQPVGTWQAPRDAEWRWRFANTEASVALTGGRVFVAERGWGLVVLDRTDPRNIGLIVRTDLPGAAAVAARDADVFVGTTGDYGDGPPAGVQHVDLSSPALPVVGPNAAAGGRVVGLSLQGDALWALLGDDMDRVWGLTAFDVRTPRAPRPLGTTMRFGIEGRAVFADGRAAVADRDGSAVEVYDLAVPGAPRLEARLDAPGRLLGLWGDLLYAAHPGVVDLYDLHAAVGGSPAQRIATLDVPGYEATAFQPGWVDEAGRVILNRWGSGWVVLETVGGVAAGRRRVAVLPWASSNVSMDHR